jgi:Leucine-rich repeat (LRR) protein
VSERKEPVTRRTVVHSARRLLDWLGWLYLGQALVLDGAEAPATVPEMLYEYAFDDWHETLRDAPPALLKPGALRLSVSEAIAESQLKTTSRFEARLGRARTIGIMSAFARAVKIDAFPSTRGKTFREWLPGALAVPMPADGAPTPDDARLRDELAALGDDARRTRARVEVHATSTLRDLTPLAALPALREVVILDAPMLVDLSPLAEIPTLETLRVSAPIVRDLTPLARMTSLRSLKLDTAEDLDYAPLAALTRLEELQVSAARDLSALEGLPSLTSLTITSRHVTPDLTTIAGLRGLTELRLVAIEGLTSAAFAADLTSLVHLDLNSCEDLTDLSAIARLTSLEELRLGGTGARDLAPLEALPRLRVLSLPSTPVATWPPFASLPCLEELDLKFTSIASFAGVERGVALRKLDVAFNDAPGFADITPLAQLTQLRELDISELKAIVDLSPLRALTSLRVLRIANTGVRDLSPLAALTALENVYAAELAITNVEALAGLASLRTLSVARCEELESLRPLARCLALEWLECDHCDALKGPKTLEALRAPPPPVAKRFPSAGPAVNRPGEAAVIDLRGHVPKRPPEGWSLPERETADPDVFWLEAEKALVMAALWHKDEQHLLMVQLWPRTGVRMNDKQAARILRRFRATESFVESGEMLLEGFDHGRCFLAIAHPASPDTWGAFRERSALIRVEANDEGGPWATADVRHHLPSPLPEGWSTQGTKRPEDVACFVSTPEAEMTVLLSAFDPGDGVKLAVSLMPPRPQFGARVGDATARALLARFRGRGELIERVAGPFARAPGMRIFVGRPSGALAS